MIALAGWLPLAADELELTSGERVAGTVVAVSRKGITFKVALKRGSMVMRYPLSRIRAYTRDGTRKTVGGTTYRPAAPPRKAEPTKVPPAPPPDSQPGPAPASPTPRTRRQRSRAQVMADVNRAGRTPPDWFDSTRLQYPQTLDLSWPEKPGGKWNTQRNVGQYWHSVVNPNPNRSRPGIKFLHHLLTVNKTKPKVLLRTMQALGAAYRNFEQDWARSAFWYQQADKKGSLYYGSVINLAECYYKLGNQQMAEGLLRRLGNDQTRNGTVIKLWSDMGEIDKALAMAANYRRARWPSGYLMAAGEACRLHGRYQEAIDFYEKAAAECDKQIKRSPKRSQHFVQSRQRARDGIEAIELYETLDLSRIADGDYQGKSLAYAGDLHVRVTVKRNRITSVKVTKHKEKQFFSAISDTTKDIVERQGVKGIDATTGATITCVAIVNAAAKALASVRSHE